MSKSGKILEASARQIIANVIKYCEEEKQNGYLKNPLAMSAKRAADMTGTSLSTIKRIKGEVEECAANNSQLSTPGKIRRTRKDKKAFSDFDLCAIRNIILTFYTMKKEVPTIKKITQAVNEELESNVSREIVRRTILSIGFKFIKCKNKKTILIERHNVAVQRQNYLRRIIEEKARNPHRHFVYVDVTMISPQRAPTKPVQTEDGTTEVSKPDPPRDGYIIAHAGTEIGFINGAFYIYKSETRTGDLNAEMNFNTFSKWVKEMLLPNLPHCCLIIMDTAPYNSEILSKAPTASNNVAEMKSWLTENNINFKNDLVKSDLLQLVKEHKTPTSYIIDSIFREAGHDVLRIPEFHCDLNPIEFIWNIVKHRVTELYASQETPKVEAIAEEVVKGVTSSEWKKCCEHVYNIELKYRVQDAIYHEEIEKLTSNMSGEIDSDTE